MKKAVFGFFILFVLPFTTDTTINATSALGATVGAAVDINPWLIGAGVGYRL